MKITKKRVLVVLGGVVVLSCALGCILIGGLAVFGPGLYEGMLANSSLPVGEQAPDFEVKTLSGETVKLSDYRGHPVLLTFGASWCPDCRREVPLLQSLHESESSLAILMIDTKEDRATVQAYADEFGMTFPIGLDEDGVIATEYRVWAIPTELLIDEAGIVRARLIESVTKESLAKLLAEAGIEGP
ncbi:MAG TPA: redoxin domain-containing protein [Anaerolineales bacterium]|nr:redoxin domain-containing protein [Anaerolineales bacterium]